MASDRPTDFRRNHHRRGATSDSVRNTPNVGNLGGLQPLVPPVSPVTPVRPI